MCFALCTNEAGIPYIEHPELPRAYSDNTVLWRYFPLAGFLALLEHQALHFTRVDRLPNATIDRRGKSGLGAASGATAETSLQPPAVRQALELMQIASQAVFANCWYSGLSEWHEPWEQYGGRNNAVAVRSSVGALKAAVGRSPRKVHIASVLYFEYETDTIPAGNAYLSALHKHASFAQEKEVRALTLQMGDVSNVFTPGPELGIEISVDTENLFEEVRTAPGSEPWFDRLVATLARRYGATWPVFPAILRNASRRS